MTRDLRPLRLPLAVLAASLLLAGPALAKECVPKDANSLRKDRLRCAVRAGPALKPYDPRAEPRRDPGFIDLGNGTSLRVNGRAGFEGDWRRR